MRKILLALGIMALICTPAMAGFNANGALIVHTNDAYTYSAGTICTTTLGQPADCASAVTQSNKDFVVSGQKSTVWFLAAFLPSASPRVASVYFGTDVDDVNFDAGSNFGFCGPAGTQQVPDPTWPYDSGNSVGFGTPVLGNTLFRFYYFGLDNYDNDPAAPNPWWCSAINPTGGFAAFYDDNFPPGEDRVTQFGCVKWYEPGFNTCPHIIVASGACCFPTGLCVVLEETACTGQGGHYSGDGTVCEPTNPCAQPGACCDPETGACAFVLEAACLPPMVFLGGECQPTNPCPQKGACCEPVTGICSYVLQANCLAPNVWHPEWTCNPNNCPVEPRGACCAPDGSCTITYAAECVAPSTWHGDWTCDPNNCPPPVATEPTTWGQIKANYR